MGVGLLYQREIHGFLLEHAGAIDYLEVIPDTAWTDHGIRNTPRYVDDANVLRFFRQLRGEMPIVAHSIGLFIGSAHRFRQEHVEQLCRWDAMLDFPWHSDHLAFSLVEDASGQEYLPGVSFPVMRDVSMLELLTERIQRVQTRIGKPFLLENNVSYIQYVDEDFDEPTFLNELCSRSGCGMLLDLHNVYANWRNGVIDIDDFLSSLDLSHVQEVHLAGGLVYNGFYLDAHSGRVPKELWRIAGEVLPRCQNLNGITFELLGSWFAHMGESSLLETIEGLRQLAGGSRPRAVASA